MKILGVSGLGHDAAVSLVVDGKPIFAIEEERLLRTKYQWTFPFKALPYTLDRTGTDPDDIDYITFYFNTARYNAVSFFRSLSLLRRHSISEFCRHQVSRYGFSILARALPQESLRLAFVGKRLPPVIFIDHHLSHLGSCYFASGFEEAAALIVDSVGEYPCTSLFSTHQNKIENIRSVCFPHSLGLVYTAITQHLGLHPFGDEYKTMGLAAHGERNRRYEDFFRHLIRLKDDGTYCINTRLINFHLMQNITSSLFLSDEALQILGPPRKQEEAFSERFRDIAFALQARLEEAILHLLASLQKKTGHKNLCLAGGVALNCAANRKIFEQTDFQNIFIQPAAGDAGASLGSALYHHNMIGGNSREYVLNDTFLGPAFSDDEIKKALKNSLTPYRVVENPARTAAELIHAGKIVGWFQGRLEFGPRALGNRSILSDPRNEAIKVKLNLIKNRVSFRPYAASVLIDHVDDYFNWSKESPFMLVAVPVNPAKKDRIPAVVHQDDTCRIQTVDRERTPLFYQVIEEFHKLSAVPLVLNTSLNTAGEAIASSPIDAIVTFSKTPLDVLIMGNCLLEKS